MPSAKLLADVLSGWGTCGEPIARNIDFRGHFNTGRAKRRRGPDREGLVRAIEGDVIPRLMLTHRLGSSGIQLANSAEPEPPSHEDVIELVRLVLEHDATVALTFVEAIRSRGTPIEALYLDLLAPAARLLGEMWKADLCDFADVTVGLSRLQHLLHDFSPTFDEDCTPQMSDHRILLVPVPGEQHTFGIMLVEEFFRRSGWECCTAMPQSNAEVSRLVRKEHFDVVGVSVSGDCMFGRTEPCIETVRKSSKNKDLTVMVGGALFNERPELVSRVGADFSAVDGREAVLQLRSVLGTQAARLR